MQGIVDEERQEITRTPPPPEGLRYLWAGVLRCSRLEGQPGRC